MGLNHCAWLADDGSVWTSGSNGYGQLGLGDKNHRYVPSHVPNLPPISCVRSGRYATICLDTSGNLWSFGYNGYYQLGFKDNTHRSSAQMVPNIPPVRSFSFTYQHTVFLCENGSVWAFGSNLSGQLGIQFDGACPVQLPASNSPNETISISCGYAHSLFLTPEGQVFSCGANKLGQLGLGDSTNRFTPTLIPNMINCIQIVCGGNLSCMVDSFHCLWVCGSYNCISQETPLCIPNVGLIQSISVGYNHILCVNESDELWGWGNPASGQLGNGSTEPYTNPVLIKNNVQFVLCSGYSSFIRNTFSEDFCCGKNHMGQLGLGNTNEQLSFSKFSEESFKMCFPVLIRKFSQKSARSALPLPE